MSKKWKIHVQSVQKYCFLSSNMQIFVFLLSSSSWLLKLLKYENVTSSFGRLCQNIAPRSVPHVQHDYFSSLNQSNNWFVALSLTLPSSNLKVPVFTNTTLSITTENMAIYSGVRSFRYKVVSIQVDSTQIEVVSSDHQTRFDTHRKSIRFNSAFTFSTV